jgi:hypothetical protein
MKNNLLTPMFIFLLCLSALFNCYLVYRYNSSTSQLQILQPKVQEVAKVLNIVQQLLVDTQEYNRVAKNPDMTRLLQSLVATNQKPATAPAKPATK